jgi:plasmid stability protein
MTVNVPDEVARRLEAAAAARGVSVDEFAAEVLIDNVPEVATTSERRHLAFVGVGASEHGVSDRIEELLLTASAATESC